MGVETAVEAFLPSSPNGSGRIIRKPLKRKRRGPVGLAGLKRELTKRVIENRWSTLAQLTVAVRGERRDNDRSLARALLSLVRQGYVDRIQTHPFTPAVYFVPAGCVRGRDAARTLFGDDSKIVSSPGKLRWSVVAHGLGVTWVRVLAEVGSAARGWVAEFLDHQDLIQRFGELAVVPDGVIMIDRQYVGHGTLGFLVEYQRWDSARRTTRDKVDRYRNLLPEFERLLGVERAWVLVVMDRPERWVREMARGLEGEGEQGNFFLGASEKVLAVEPREFWTAPVFHLPGETGPCSLFKARNSQERLHELG